MSQAVGKLDIRNLKVSLRKSEVVEEGEKITKREEPGNMLGGERRTVSVPAR